MCNVEWGVAVMPLPGQTVSGDMYIIKHIQNIVLVAVVDGLGHGYEAAAASKIAISTLDTYAHEPIISLIRRCHEALKGKRGAVMSMALINLPKKTIAWTGVGNVEGILLRADEKSVHLRESLLLRGGVLGYQLPSLKAYVISLMPGDTLIFATDGIRNGFYEGIDLRKHPQQIADRIMAQYARRTDDALVLVMRFTGCRQ